MKSTDIIQPKAITAPLAYEGKRFEIPEAATGSEKASIAEGFPAITMQALDDGGLPPRGEDCNGMFYLSTDQRVYLQNGGLITFNQEVSDAIGGYPAGAILDYIDGNDIYYKVKSLIDDNTNNFVTNPALIDDINWKFVSSAGTGAMRNIGETVFSLLPLDDAGLHLLDGALISGTGAYAAFVAKIAQLYGNGSNIPKYFTTETLWQQSITNYGVCGKFVYDAAANTVRLPKVTGIVEGTLDANALGDLVQAGLPALVSAGAHTHSRGTMEITGALDGYDANRGFCWDSARLSGAFSRTSASTGGSGMSSTSGTCYGINFNASKSWTGATSSNGNHTHSYNGNVQTSDTVQPQTIKGFLYMVVANSVKTEIEVDIDNVMTDLNGKADIDLNNVSTISESSAVGQQLAQKLNQNQLTNSILELPETVKYQHTSSELTILAGTRIIIPYGVEDLRKTYPVGSSFLTENLKVVDSQFAYNKFFVWVELQSDIVVNNAGVTGKKSLFLDIENYSFRVILNSNCISGTSASSAQIWYDTTSNIVKSSIEMDSNWAGTLSLPLLEGEFVLDTGFSEITNVFNGIGYLGSIVWVDKGIKGLIPNGRNEDGTLRNIVLNTYLLRIKEANTDATRTLILQFNNTSLGEINQTNYIVSDVEPKGLSGWSVWWNTLTNYQYIKNFSDSNSVWSPQYYLNDFARVSVSPGKIDSMRIGKPFQALDVNNTSLICSLSTPSNKTEYVGSLNVNQQNNELKAPASGWFTVYYQVPSSMYLRLTNITSGQLAWECRGEGVPVVSCRVSKGDICRVSHELGGTSLEAWFTYDKGEI